MANLRVGTVAPSALRMGTLIVSRVYMGTVLVWSSAGFNGIVTAAGKRPVATINGTFTIASGFVGSLNTSSNRPTPVINGTFTVAPVIGTVTAAANRPTATINGAATPSFTGTVVASANRPTATISGTVTNPTTFAKYRTFNGSTDHIDFTLGNLSGAGSVPQTMVCVVRNVSNSGNDAEIIASSGWDPLDWFYINGGTTLGYYDGASNVNGPLWISGTNWTLFAFRSNSGSAATWSKSVYSGSAWPTPTHTSGGITLANRTTWAAPILIGNNTGFVFDCVLFARFNVALTDAQINAMTGGVSVIQGTAGCTNLWMVGQTTPADLVGTATATVTGTTLSSGNSPFQN